MKLTQRFMSLEDSGFTVAVKNESIFNDHFWHVYDHANKRWVTRVVCHSTACWCLVFQSEEILSNYGAVYGLMILGGSA